MRLRTIAHGRAGDKGRRVNLSVIAFDPADYDASRATSPPSGCGRTWPI